MARSFDTAPSVTGNAPQSLHSEREYPDFVAKWMGTVSTAPVPPGAIASFAFKIEPPVRAGYKRVGGKEGDDAFKEFANWCSANGGRARPYGYADREGVERRLTVVLQRPASEVSDGAYDGCERNSIVIALISIHLSASVANEPVLLTVTHYTQPAIAQAAAAMQDAKRAAAVRNQQTISAAVAEAREQDGAYRKTLKVGQRVRWDRDFGAGFAARGLVVELRPPIALIQFDNLQPSPQWVQIDELRRPN